MASDTGPPDPPELTPRGVSALQRIAEQCHNRGWALISIDSVETMALVDELADAQVIEIIDKDVRWRADLTPSANEVICKITESGTRLLETNDH